MSTRTRQGSSHPAPRALEALPFALLAASVISCGARPSEQPPGPPSPLAVTLRAVRSDRGSEGPFPVAERARPGDRIAFYVTPSRNAYIGIVQFYADGTQEVLFPRSGATAEVTAGRSTRVPPKGQWLQVYGAPGEEHVFVVATVEPLDRSDPELFSLVSDVRRAPVADPVPGASWADPANSADPTSSAETPALLPAPGASGTHAPTASPTTPPRVPRHALLVSSATSTGTSPLPAPAATPAASPPPPPGPKYAAGMKGFNLRSARLRALKLVGTPEYEASADRNVVVLHFVFEHVADGTP